MPLSDPKSCIDLEALPPFFNLLESYAYNDINEGLQYNRINNPGIFITKFRFPIRLIGKANFLPISNFSPDQFIDMVSVLCKINGRSNAKSADQTDRQKLNSPDHRSILADHLIGDRPL